MLTSKCWFAFTLTQLMVSIYIKESGATINAINTSVGNTKCIMKMMRENFHRNSTVIIFLSNHPDYSQFESDFVKNIFESINCNVVIYSAEMYHSRMGPLGVKRNFLILLGERRLTSTLTFLHLLYIWDSKAVFLVVAGNIDDQKLIIEEDQMTLNESTSSHIHVGQILLNSSLQPQKHYIYIPSNEFTTNLKLRQVGSCIIDGRIDLINSEKYSTNGKVLRVGAIHAPPFLFVAPNVHESTGSEVTLVKTIAEQMKMTVNFQYYSNMDNLGDLFITKSGSLYGSGMVNDLLLNKIDIAIGNIVISNRGMKNFAISTPYTMDRLIWVLPKPKSVLKLPIFPFIYSWKMALLFISVNGIYPYLAHIATNHFHKASNAECTRYRTYPGTCLSYFAIATGSPVDASPKTTRMRFFLLMWLLYTYHINMLFASTLISFLAVEQYEQPFQTEDQLMSSEIQLGIDQRTLNYLKKYFHLHNQTNTLSKNMTGKVVYCDSTSECLSRIVQNQNFAMTLSYNYFTYAKHEYADKSGELSLTPLPDTIVSVPIGIISKKGFALQSKINIIILRINEAGLFKHWNDKTIQLLKLKRIYSAEDDNEHSIDVCYTLKFSDLSTVFLGIIIELLVCFIVFLGELVVYRMKLRAQQKCSSNDDVVFEYVNQLNNVRN